MNGNKKTGFDVLKKQVVNVSSNLLKNRVSDRDIKSWDKRLKDQRERDWDNYAHLHIDLGTVQYDQSFMIAGEYLYVEESSSVNAKAKIKLNRVSNESLDLEKGVKIETVFVEIFVTNDALEDEWLDLVFGINFKYHREMELVVAALAVEAQPCLILTNVNPGVNTVAGAYLCQRVLIRTHIGNAGTIWIDFNNAAVVNACYELTAGDAISVPLSNTNLINGILTNGGDIATIVYEV